MSNILESIEIHRKQKIDNLPKVITLDFTKGIRGIKSSAYKLLKHGAREESLTNYGIYPTFSELYSVINSFWVLLARNSNNKIYFNINNNGEKQKLDITQTLFICEMSKTEDTKTYDEVYKLPLYDNIECIQIQRYNLINSNTPEMYNLYITLK